MPPDLNTFAAIAHKTLLKKLTITQIRAMLESGNYVSRRYDGSRTYYQVSKSYCGKEGLSEWMARPLGQRALKDNLVAAHHCLVEHPFKAMRTEQAREASGANDLPPGFYEVETIEGAEVFRKLYRPDETTPNSSIMKALSAAATLVATKRPQTNKLRQDKRFQIEVLLPKGSKYDGFLRYINRHHPKLLETGFVQITGTEAYVELFS